MSNGSNPDKLKEDLLSMLLEQIADRVAPSWGPYRARKSATCEGATLVMVVTPDVNIVATTMPLSESIALSLMPRRHFSEHEKITLDDIRDEAGRESIAKKVSSRLRRKR